MKCYTTNYTNTFIEVAEDCPAYQAEIPWGKNNNQTIAKLQYDLLIKNPYVYTSDEVLFYCYTTKNNFIGSEFLAEKDKFFSKGQPCFRSSPLTKRYGWGVHFNKESKMAIYPVESTEYVKFKNDSGTKHLKAMRSKKV